MFRNSIRIAGVVIACIWVLCGTVSGQIRSSAITGTVTDPSGAVIPNANVVVTNEQTNEAFATKTTMAGAYTVPYLPPGQYTVSVSATGFQTYRVSGITLGTATTVRVDASLTTGTIATTIEVTAREVSHV